MQDAGTEAPVADTARLIWHFGPGDADGRADMKDVLGGKGANLAEMCQPRSARSARVHDRNGPSAVSTTRTASSSPTTSRPACGRPSRASSRTADKKFGDPERPLLVSVRSGAALSMPGMMDTVLNLGLNEAATVEGMARPDGNRRFALDALPPLHSDVRRTWSKASRLDPFELVLDRSSSSRRRRARTPSSMPRHSRASSTTTSRTRQARTGEPVSRRSVRTALWGAIRVGGVRFLDEQPCGRVPLDSTTSPRLIGTAVNVQAMVFGNLGAHDERTGVCFTRDPSTGENVFYGEYLDERAGRGRRGRHPHAAGASPKPG